MIVIITANSYFASGITSLAALSAASAYSDDTAVAVSLTSAPPLRTTCIRPKRSLLITVIPTFSILHPCLRKRINILPGILFLSSKRIYFSIPLRILLLTLCQAWYWNMPAPRNACALISGILTRIPSAIRLNKPLGPSIAIFI